MKIRKIRLEIFDEKGMRTSMWFDGKLCKERVIEFIEALEFTSTRTPKEEQFESETIGIDNEDLTLKERLELFLRYEFPKVWFTSLDVKSKYEEVYDQTINLSTVSTYLARMYRNDILGRRGNRTQREYRIAESSEADFDQVELRDKGHLKVNR
ncbi:MAG: hypothetical protein SVM80_04900 [Halobacteriota archaeon]|nr:hypothetical protein [Halobacteriota archaeon]